MLKNGIVWKDTQGNPLHAHGGYMIFHEGYYYWYGEDRRDNFYVSCYRSQNLTDWESYSDDKFEDGRLSRAYYAKVDQRGWKKGKSGASKGTI